MKGRSHSLFPIIVLTLLAGATVWLENVTRHGARVERQVRHDPDYIVEKLTLHRFDPQGRTQYILVADNMTHFGDDQTTQVTRPRLDYLARPQRLHLEADRGEISKTGDVVVLHEHVVGHQDALGSVPATTLNTEQLTVWTDDERFSSNLPVTVTRAGSVINANSMSGNNLSGELQFTGRVRGVFQRKESQVK
ncbi:MAG: LPS export ABC transporter periplasmic protein LptC [Zoogloea sp.]|nr:LPS export ABC transporter periplasmic protein LptC [Zoogloea sp.]